ncbi:MAG: PQQ-binding-like beta-propeller repeat protein [Planctomycetota bacterium]|nr:PQQ-binding-like beta-propeller repeat protein [Planctomycetota bacterium]
MRWITRLLIGGLCAAPLATAVADDAPQAKQPAPAAKTAPRAQATLEAVLLKTPGAPVAVAPGHAPGEFLFGTREKRVVRFAVGRGLAWQSDVGELPVDRLAMGPDGKRALASTARELIALAGADGTILWRAKRAVAFAFSPDGTQVFTVSKKGALAVLDAATGAQATTRQAADKREVVLASMHAASGLAVLGVADG